MAEKKPQVGEFWRTRGGDRRYVAAVLPDVLEAPFPLISASCEGETETHIINGNVYNRKEHSLDLLEHLPWCTSFDDLDPVAEVWPKWYINPRGFSDGTAYIRRDTEVHAMTVSEAGNHAPMPWREVDNRLVSNGSWLEVTESEALARLHPHTPTCPDCGEPLTPGHADVCPMAWVTQDRVAVRTGVDQVRWSDWDDGLWVSGNGNAVPKMHGEVIPGVTATLQVRCRRRDLPPLPSPEPSTPDRSSLVTRSKCRVCGEEFREGDLVSFDTQNNPQALFAHSKCVESPSTPDPGEGWRLLERGEVIERGDYVMNDDATEWVPSFANGCKAIHGHYRRRITPAPCICPQPGVVSLDCPVDGLPYLGHGFSEQDTVPVRLWINEENGVVFQSDVQVLPGDQEILIVGKEFRVKKAMQE